MISKESIFVLIALTILLLVNTCWKSEVLKEKEIPIIKQIDTVLIHKTTIGLTYRNLGMMNASWYGPRFHGRTTANGETYNQMAFTVAHKSLKFGTLLRLTNLKTRMSIIVRVNDRGPYIPGRQIDLSMKVAMVLDIYKRGTGKVKVEELKIDGLLNPIIM